MISLFSSLSLHVFKVSRARSSFLCSDCCPVLFCLPFSLHILQSVCLLLCWILLQQQPNFPTGIHKVWSYLFMTTERSLSICTFIHVFMLSLSVTVFTLQQLCIVNHMSKSPASRSEAAGNPQVSSYIEPKHWNQPAPASANSPLSTLPPPPSSEKGLKSRSNWFGL